MIYNNQGTVGHRHVNALAWAVASELCRRDNSLYVALTGYGGSGSHADAMMLTGPGGRDYQARRSGSGFIVGNGPEKGIGWPEAFEMRSPREIAIELERLHGLRLPLHALPTTRRALGYRVMAAVLAMTLNDRDDWREWERQGGPLDKRSTAEALRLQDCEDVRWHVTRRGEQIAILDNFGWLQIGGHLVDLMIEYNRHGRRIYPLALSLFGQFLQ